MMTRNILFGLAVALGLSVPAARAADSLAVRAPELAPPSRDAAAYEAAREAMAKGDWDAARELATGEGRILVEWHRLRAGRGEFADYVRFLRDHADWPGLDYLRRQGEAALVPGLAPEAVRAYFAGQPPVTGMGTLRLVEAYEALGQRGEAEAQVVLAWHSLPLGAEIEATLRARYPALLPQHDAARLDAMLWDHEWAAAERIATSLSAGAQALAKARKALAEDTPGVDGFIEAVPTALQGDPGLAYERFRWRMRRGRLDDALPLIVAQSTSLKALGEPARWAPARADLARYLMREGRPQEAYRLAASHYLTSGSNYADLEWLAGYLALTYLSDPVLALDHFNHLRLSVNTPISLGRAGYWEGRALERMGAEADARAAYRFAATHQTSFYGQLAAERLGLMLDPTLTGAGAQSDWHQAGFVKSPVFRAAVLLREAGDLPLAGRFLRHLSETLSYTDMVQLGDAVEAMGEPYLSLRLGKYAAERGVVLPRSYYPLHPLAKDKLPVAPELALSIARRESEFFVAAQSGVGARGLMQLMPGTAKAMARELDLTYDLAGLTSDPNYNARLGSAYLAHLIEEFGNNPALVAAGYNAGPGRPRQWITTFGDPRSAGIDPVDWIEHIPFDETRNYVMRVAESLSIYRARLAGKPVPIRLSEELRGR